MSNTKRTHPGKNLQIYMAYRGSKSHLQVSLFWLLCIFFAWSIVFLHSESQNILYKLGIVCSQLKFNKFQYRIISIGKLIFAPLNISRMDKKFIEVFNQLQHFIYMNSRFGSSIQRASRGSSRGLVYCDMLKHQPPSYNGSIKNNTHNTYEANILKNSSKQPTYTSTFKSSLKQHNTNVNPYSYKYTAQKLKEKDTKYGLMTNMNETDTKADLRDSRNQQFRIRPNAKEKELANSRKTQKDQEDRLQKEKELAQSRRRIEQQKIQKQRQQQNYRIALQKQIKQKQAMELKKKRQSQIDLTLKRVQINEKKQLASMTNSTATGTSDISSSSLRHGGSSYSFSTSSNKTIGLVGLSNIGNTCFMNSILQCMFNLPGFNDYFLNGSYVDEMKSSARVAESYAKTVKMMRTSTSRSETPSQLKSAIGAKKSRFAGYSQQDAQQFLAALLQLLSIDLNRAKNPKYKQLTADLNKQSLKQISDDWWNYNKQREDSVVCDFFSGQVLSRVVCSKCRNQSIAFDNIWDMALNFNTNDRGDLMKMIQNFLKVQTIANDYYCSKCKGFHECQRKIDFYRLPKILVFQLKRFSYGRFRKVKLNNRVLVEKTLDLSSLVKQSNHSSVKNPIYNLVGVVNHSGDIDFGHYTAQCRNPINGKWYDFNDSSVHQISLNQDFQSSSPYLLFYAKKDI